MALKRIEACKTEADGVKAIINLGLEKFPLPGEPGFPLGGLFTAPQTKDEGGKLFSPIYCQVFEIVFLLRSIFLYGCVHHCYLYISLLT